MRKICCFALLLCLLLSGCAVNAGLTALPRTEEARPLLSRHILSQLFGRAVYTVPLSGDMSGPVLETDLDGDGEAELIACLVKRSGGSRHPCVEVYSTADDRLSLIGEIRGEGDHIHTLCLPVLSADGRTAIAVGWGLAESRLHGVTVCVLTEDGLETVYSGACLSLNTADMDRDGLDEIVLVDRDEAGQLQAVMLYDAGHGVRATPGVPLSQGMELLEARCVNVGFDRAALLCEGYVESQGYVTDVILASGERALQNVFLSPLSGISEETLRALPIPCTDVNGDGTAELPLMRTGDTDDSLPADLVLLDWYRCDETPLSAPLFTSCYHRIHGWNMRLPEVPDWGILPVTSVEAAGVSATLFRCVSGEGEQGMPLFELYTLTGENAAELETLLELHPLTEAGGKTYAWRLYNTPEGSPFTDSTIPGLVSLLEPTMSVND